jgi:uncharacterized protein YcbK (DUF882 family)
MLPTILELKLAATLMSGWMAASTPVPVPAQSVALMMEAKAASPVEINLYDENLQVSERVLLDRDGSADPQTTRRLTDLFRCRFTGHRAPMAKRTLAMLADLAERYEGKQIEFVSAHRATRGESWTSPHRGARALDFRIRGIELREIRDYLWRKYTGVGIGWYPAEQFVHMDTRPGQNDTAWTYQNGDNKYHPYWAELARAPTPPKTLRRGPGS